MWTVALAGRFNSGTKGGLVSLFIAYGAVMGASYVINQLVDSDGDDINKKLFFIADGIVNRGCAIAIAGILAFIGVVWLLSLGVFFGIIGILSFTLAGICYNLPPFSWKDHPVLAPLVTMVSGVLAFLLGCLPEFSLALLVKTIPYLTAVGAVALLTAAPDIEGDRITNKRTFPIVYGETFTVYLAVLLCVVSAVISWWTKDRIIFWPSLISIPVFVNAAMSVKKSAVILAIKFPVFLISLAVGFRFPGYLVLMVVYLLFARWYFKNRFNIEYPSFNME